MFTNKCDCELLVYNMIKFFLLVTNQGQPRIRKYYGYPDEELQFETDLIKKCLTRNEHLVGLLHWLWIHARHNYGLP